MGFPVLIETTENRMDDPVHAFDVGEYDHGPGATAAAFAEYAVESLLAGDLLRGS